MANMLKDFVVVEVAKEQEIDREGLSSRLVQCTAELTEMQHEVQRYRHLYETDTAVAPSTGAVVHSSSSTDFAAYDFVDDEVHERSAVGKSAPTHSPTPKISSRRQARGKSLIQYFNTTRSPSNLRSTPSPDLSTGEREVVNGYDYSP